MFVEYLREHPLKTLIGELPSCPFPSIDDREAWEALPEPRRASLRALAAGWRGVDYPLLRASQYMAFDWRGDRVAWERPYFDRRRKLIAAALGACIDGDPADLDAAADGLWLICEESSWVISAHNGGEHAGVEPRPEEPLPDVDAPYVDLFAAQTAMALTLVCDLLGPRLDGLSPRLRRRVGREVERRVLTPFEARDDFWWMGVIRKDLCNWTPWIVSNVMLCACGWVRDRARLCALLERGCAMLDRYLDVVPADGGCDEGAGYWSMAGGALLDCLELLERVTGGRMAFWNDAKLGNLLRYPMNAWLGGEWFVNFADCDAKPDIPGERLAFAGRKLGDQALIAFGNRFAGDPAAQLNDTPQLWRLLNGLFAPETEGAEVAEPPRDVWLSDLEQRLVRRGGMVLACKGGANAGSHSHNDCGGFILCVDGEPQVVDAGNMTYTAKTFSDQRESLWNIRAAYHNVPMIGGHEQAGGWDRRARGVAATADGLRLDMAPAYPEDAGALACERQLELREDGCVLRDHIRLARPGAVREVFLLRNRPEAGDGCVRSGRIEMRIPAGAGVAVEEVPVADPRMGRNYPGSLWRVAVDSEEAIEHELVFRIERNDG